MLKIKNRLFYEFYRSESHNHITCMYILQKIDEISWVSTRHKWSQLEILMTLTVLEVREVIWRALSSSVLTSFLVFLLQRQRSLHGTGTCWYFRLVHAVGRLVHNRKNYALCRVYLAFPSPSLSFTACFSHTDIFSSVGYQSYVFSRASIHGSLDQDLDNKLGCGPIAVVPNIFGPLAYSLFVIPGLFGLYFKSIHKLWRQPMMNVGLMGFDPLPSIRSDRWNCIFQTKRRTMSTVVIVQNIIIFTKTTI